MPSGPRSRGRTASDVEQEYSHRIEDLMSEFEHRIFPRLSRRNFDDLAKWARSTYAAKSESEAENQQLKRNLNDANAQIATLRHKLKDETEQKQILQMDHSETRGRLESQIMQLKRDNDVVVKSWESYAHDLHHSHEKNIRDLSRAHDEQTDRLQQSHQMEKIALDQHINKLLSDIMVAQADSRAWSDEKLKAKFVELKRLVDKVTSPHFGGEVQDMRALHQLDTNGFLSRVKDRSHFLLRNALWNILHDRFFSSLWGFGALGPRSGRASLVRIYGSWRSIFGGTDISENSISAVFSSDRVANQWRSVTFESIVAGLMSVEEGGLHSALRDIYESNIGGCEKEIVDLLLRVTGKYPGNQAVKELTRSAAELGLQFGVQPSRMELDQPAHKQVVEIGKGFVDCVNGEIDKGKSVEVDLFSSPGLTRVGDGGKDFQVEISLVPGQVYPLTR